MPKDFEMCVKRGGKVRTQKLSESRYIRICYLDGKSYAGEVKTHLGERLKDVLGRK